jgi:hypothetical protein
VTQAVATPPRPTAHSPARPAEVAARHGPLVELNSFQVLMRRWTRMHPYNAGQVMRVTGRPDRERWKRAAEAVIAEVGLGKPRFHHGESAVEFVPAEEVVVEQAVGVPEVARGSGGAASATLQAFFNEELNRAFTSGEVPIRFCILPAPRDGLHAAAGNNGSPGEESHYLAAVYDHWIADSRAMRELMYRIFERYRSPENVPELPSLSIEVPSGKSFKQLFRKHVGYLTRLAAIRESLRNIWKHRCGYRLNLWDPLNFDSRFVYRELPAGLIERLHRFARANGASVNDLFIAVIGQAVGQYTAADRYSRPRKPMHFAKRQIGIGTIVDIRDAACEKLDQVFNLYLSCYTVLLDQPEKRPPEELTRSVAAETTRLKRTFQSVKGYWALESARFWYDLYDSPRFCATLLHKTVPVVAGISNVNMTGSWVDPDRGTMTHGSPDGAADPAGPRVLDYLRISPAGPLIPLVFTLTTIGGRLSLCVTYRTTTFREPDLLRLVDDFVRRLEQIGQTAGK